MEKHQCYVFWKQSIYSSLNQVHPEQDLVKRHPCGALKEITFHFAQKAANQSQIDGLNGASSIYLIVKRDSLVQLD